MEISFISKLKECVSQYEGTPDQNEKSQMPTADNLETVRVCFQGQDQKKFDINFIRYKFRQFICQNQEESESMTLQQGIQNADFFYQIDDKEEQLKAFEMILKLQPSNFHILHRMALLNSQLEKFERSIELYETIISLYPNHSKAFQRIAHCFIKKEQLSKAKEHLEKYVEIVPDDSQGLQELARVLEALGMRKQAIDILEKSGLKEASILNMLGNLYIGLDINKAIECYKQGIQINKGYANNYNGLGVAYNSINHYAAAIFQLKIAISLNPEQPDFHYNISISYRALKSYHKSIEHLKQSLNIDPTLQLSYEGIANNYVELGQYNDAIRFYLRTLQINPQCSNSIFNLGIAYEKNNEFIKAADCFQKYLKISPKDPDAYHHLMQAEKYKKKTGKRVMPERRPRSLHDRPRV